MSLFHSLIPFIEIAIIAVMLNYFLSFFWNTRTMDLVLGFLALLTIFALSYVLDFPVLHNIMLLIFNVAVIAVLIIFQPELRLAISKLSVKGRRVREVTQFDTFLDELAGTIYQMADKHIGAIVVLENHDSLADYAQKAVLLQADFSAELLESIFVSTTPLHDGAVIIQGPTIVAAAVILPLAQESKQVTKSMGTRHRAALGISEQTDAVAIVISEQTGRVSLAREGLMTQSVKIDRFKGVIRSIFTPPKPEKGKWNLRDWITS